MASSNKPAEMVALIKDAVKLAKKGECARAMTAASKARTIRKGPTVRPPRWVVRTAVAEYDRIVEGNKKLLIGCLGMSKKNEWPFAGARSRR